MTFLSVLVRAKAWAAQMLAFLLLGLLTACAGGPPDLPECRYAYPAGQMPTPTPAPTMIAEAVPTPAADVEISVAAEAPAAAVVQEAPTLSTAMMDMFNAYGPPLERKAMAEGGQWWRYRLKLRRTRMVPVVKSSGTLPPPFTGKLPRTPFEVRVWTEMVEEVYYETRDEHVVFDARGMLQSMISFQPADVAR